MIEFKPWDTAAEWEWMHERTKIILQADSEGIVAHRDGVIQAMCIADTFTVDGCNVHVAIDNPMAVRAGFIHEVCCHLYLNRGRQRLFGWVPDRNAKALKFDEHIGFEYVTHVPDMLATGVGCVVMKMEKEDCRWIPVAARRAA